MEVHAVPKPKKQKKKRNVVPKDVIEQVEERSGGICECCGQEAAVHKHHVYYRSQGGPHATWNLIHVCLGCHGLAHSSNEVRREMEQWADKQKKLIAG